MPARPIRAIFRYKESFGSASLTAAANPIADGRQELMAALRGRPQAASLERARRAVAPGYRFELISDSDADMAQPGPKQGMLVLQFELTFAKPGTSFADACGLALGAMRLCPRGMGSAIALSPAPELSDEALPLAASLRDYEMQVWAVYAATSCELERRALCSAAKLPAASSPGGRLAL